VGGGGKPDKSFYRTTKMAKLQLQYMTQPILYVLNTRMTVDNKNNYVSYPNYFYYPLSFWYLKHTI
jgi:hypothetical protein